MKKFIVIGLFGVISLLVGAVAFDAVIDSRTIDSWPSLVSEFYSAREQMPPLPLHTEDVLQKMAADDWSFLSNFWQVRQPGGTWYVAEGSKLAQKLKLPLTVRIWEDIRLGEIIVMSSTDGVNFQGEAVSDAPDFVDLKSFERDEGITLSAEEQLAILFDDLSPRRILWEITLKAEAEWSDLILNTRSTPASTESFSVPMMMTMSVPDAHTNDLWLA